MTVSTETSTVTYSGNGSTTIFTVTFPFLANGDIKAIHRSAAGVETTWAETTDYTLAGAGGATGTLTAVTAPASGTTLTILRDMSFTQETDYVENDPFPAGTHEEALDRLTMIAQQIKNLYDRAVRISETVSDSPSLLITGLAADRANRILKFDGSGNISLATLVETGSVILDEDNFASDSATQAPSQQSVGAYVRTGAFTFTNKTHTSPIMTGADIRSLIGGSDAAGDLAYHNGTRYVRLAKGTTLQHLRMNTGATAPEWTSEGFTVGANSVTASGIATTIITGIPSWVVNVDVWFRAISTNGTSSVLVQLGTGTGPTYATSGYVSFCATAGGVTSETVGFQIIEPNAAADSNYGRLSFAKVNNGWELSGSIVSANGMRISSGGVVLGADLTAIKAITENATDTFDAGYFAVYYR